MANYLYNGIELPALPSVDKSTFPYVAIMPIYEMAGSTIVLWGYGAYFTVSPIFYNNAVGYININDTNADLRRIFYEYELDGTEWVGDGSIKELSIAFLVDDVTWSNYDILNDDGSVYLAASDPVPVLEWHDKTPYRRMNGQWVKQDTYKRVNGQWVKQDEYRRE